MMIRSFTNSKSEAFYVMGFSSLDVRHRMFRALTESAVFLHDLREHMEYLPFREHRALCTAAGAG